MAQVRIGTSGWHYRHWIGRYYPKDIRPAAMLDQYVRDFDTVELNNTFTCRKNHPLIRGAPPRPRILSSL